VGSTIFGVPDSEPVEGARLYETLIQAMSDLGLGVVVTDAGQCIYANDAYAELTGYSIDELLAMSTLLEISDPDEREALTQRMRERLAGGHVEDHYEAGMIRKDGQRVDCEVSVKFIPVDGRNLLVSVIRDISERRRMEEVRIRLREAEWQREQALQLHDAVVQGLAVAKMAMDIGHTEMSEEAIARTLEKARHLVGELLTTMEGAAPGKLLSASSAESTE
jgi:PAS domain S-box-containing protein